MKKTFIFGIIVFIILIAGGASYGIWFKFFKNKTIACTQEAKLCPDGSYVGRTGPACEFAACPEANPGWKTFSDSNTGASFQYPEQLPTQFAQAFDWPPQIQIINEPFSCINAGTEISPAGKTEQKIINNKDYCVTTKVEGAAGSIYTQYAYAFAKGGKTAILNFTIRTPQCGNYPDPEKTECENEQQSFNIDDIAGKMAESLSIKQ